MLIAQISAPFLKVIDLCPQLLDPRGEVLDAQPAHQIAYLTVHHCELIFVLVPGLADLLIGESHQLR